MLRTIHCDACNKSGMFDIHFKFMLESRLCEKCHHHSGTDWDYYFCNIACLMNWLKNNEIADKGFPCRDCCDMKGVSTGFRYGFESNGTCDTCKGTMRVQSHKLQEWETRVTSEAS